MQAISYLQEIKNLDVKINNSIDELNILEALAIKTNFAICDNKVKASQSQDKMADCVIKIAEMRQRVNEDIIQFINYIQEAKELIYSSCDADCCRLLYLRYFNYCAWEDIAAELNYSYQWVAGKLHSKALAQLQAEIDKRVDKS